VKDILSGCPDAREIWKACAVREHPDGSVRRLRLPCHGAGEVAVRIMALSPLRGRQFLRLVVLLREDDGAVAGGEGSPAGS
jgi:hypothetical protein